LADEVRELESRLRQGGGEKKAERQHAQGKLTARERVDLLFDHRSRFLEIGLLVAHDQYDGDAPSAGVVTGVGVVHGRQVVVVANDATVKAGSWWPETIRKILRSQEIAMRCRVPIVYLVDSAVTRLMIRRRIMVIRGQQHPVMIMTRMRCARKNRAVLCAGF
jgi:acetyl-CoA carboxylase carboxyltransferase component